MAEERLQRRLAAVLAADVVGYSRLDYNDGNFEVELSNTDGSTRAQEVIPGALLLLAE
jgi:class 3 adenylate cyclase